MATIDIVILVIVGAGVVVGFMKGFIRQLASILGLIVGLLAAKALYASLAEKLCPTITDSMTVAQILAFVIICATNFYFSGIFVDKSDGGCFFGMAEPLAWQWFGSIEVSVAYQSDNLRNRIYRCR